VNVPAYVLRAMRYQDLPQVVAIDRQSFPAPWSFDTYRYEVSKNSSSHMVVLAAPGLACPPRLGLPGWLDRLRFWRSANGHRAEMVAGYGGFWLSQKRAHISTIAVHPRCRGQSLGELLLAAMIRRAMALSAAAISLEVRVGNAPAINLYRKYGFAYYGVKVGYYRDNQEDAYDLRIDPLDEAYRARFVARWAALQNRITFADGYSALLPTATPDVRFSLSPEHRA
jgi:ribosomal-protein-alanine N-acetyltransferase